jgi:hypothetical protein
MRTQDLKTAIKVLIEITPGIKTPRLWVRLGIYELDADATTARVARECLVRMIGHTVARDAEGCLTNIEPPPRPSAVPADILAPDIAKETPPCPTSSSTTESP